VERLDQEYQLIIVMGFIIGGFSLAGLVAMGFLYLRETILSKKKLKNNYGYGYEKRQNGKH
jgi:hypothetical protein